MTKLALVATLAALMSAVAAFWFWFQMRRLRRAEFIRNFAWPPGLLNKLQAKYPGFSRKESALVSEGLRQFFLAYLSSGKRYVAMPSQAADELWHEFILYTRAYSDFCDEAFGGFFITRPPSRSRRRNASPTRVCDASGGGPAAKRTSIR